MSRTRRDQGQDAGPFLFDLPLEAEPERSAPEPHAEPAPRRRERPAPVRPAAVPALEEEERQAAVPVRRGARGRLAAGLADIIVHGALVVVAAGGASLLGARPVPADWPAFAALLLTFSFLYTVLPLAFWGQTLGMAWAGLAARSRSGEPLTFDQAARRWLGALATAATAGIPLLVAGQRRSLSDLVSGSITHPAG